VNNRDESERAAQRLAFAFRLGAVGSIVLGVAALTTATLAALTALAAWTGLTLFAFPTLYDYVVRDDTRIRFPQWFIRGPHQ
jgi:hypothetical protein